MTFTGITGSLCQYSDETQIPQDFQFESGLRLLMPSGDDRRKSHYPWTKDGGQGHTGFLRHEVLTW
jgi:hypothetical protein